MFDSAPEAVPRPTEKLTRPDNVRIATPADEAPLFDLLWNDMYVDNVMSAYLVPTEAKVRGHVESVCHAKRGIAGIIDGPRGPIASIGIIWSEAWYSSVGFPAEIWNYVHRDHRKGHHHYRDLRRFSLWHRADLSEKVGYPLPLEVGVSSFNRLPAKMRLWRQDGGKFAGGIFWYEGNA